MGIASLGLAAALERVGLAPVVVEAEGASLSRGLALMLTSNVGVALRRLERVTFSDGSSARFDLVVGADGIDSATRSLIHSHVEPEYRSSCAWRALMPGDDPDPVFRLSTTDGRFLGSFPVAPNLTYAFLLAHTAQVPALSRDERLAEFKELAGTFRANVSRLIQQQEVCGAPAATEPPRSHLRLLFGSVRPMISSTSVREAHRAGDATARRGLEVSISSPRSFGLRRRRARPG